MHEKSASRADRLDTSPAHSCLLRRERAASAFRGIGPQPQLPPPTMTMFPTVKIAPAIGWRADERPTPASGLAVEAFASGLDHPRNVYVLPNRDVLVAETNAPPKPDDSPGLRGFITRRIMARAGAGVPSANRIILLRDTNGHGVADLRSVFLEGLNSPFGIALIGDQLFVARHRCDPQISVPRGPDTYRRARGCADRVAGGTDQPSLDQEPRRKPGWPIPLCQHRFEQQRRRERFGCRRGAGANLAGGCAHRQTSKLRNRSAEPQRTCLCPRPGASLVDRGERARRARQRPGAGLHDFGPRRRLLWLAIQLLRPAHRRLA